MASPRNRALGGIGALSEEDRLAFERGEISISDLSRKHGVTRQTAWKAIRRRGWKRVEMASEPEPGPAPVAAPTSPDAAPKSEHAIPQGTAPRNDETDDKAEQHRQLVDGMSERAWRALAGIYYVFLGRAQKLLQSLPEGNANATALNTVVRLVSAAHEGLHNLGVWSQSPSEDRIPELVIRCYTEKEEAEIRAKAGEDAGENMGPNIAGDIPARVAPVDQQAEQFTSPTFCLKETPPGSGQELEPWLTAIGHRNGGVYLRQIAQALGGKGVGAQAALIAEIIGLCKGDPSNLLKLRETA